ncbi:MAG: tRNA pseudouridine(38-40) synthase TruA [Lachnospiraceae bacterium]|nr:tRNA pseudouridine(38-40) synthase TruA [Lachnospiraceae bacterium]
MKRIMLKVAYDGTAYHGWQIQPNGETIEGVLNRCLSELLQEKIEVIGASRTDSGVHARENIAVFDTDTLMPPKKVAYALNARLPEDIRIQKSDEVEANFHPRHCDSRKTYEYRIYNATFSMPVERLYSYFTYVPMDVEKMREAAGFFVGTHDFKSFCNADTQVENTVRQVESVEVGKADNVITIRVTGRGFLYNMVRIMAGTLMEVGRGRLMPEDIVQIIEAKDRTAAGPTAPACGLTLIKYEFL